jgi:hypothetical protein
MSDFEWVSFTQSDIEILTPVMKRAFDADARFHLGRDGGPPGYDDGSFLREWALHPKATAFRLNRGGQAAGAVILWINPATQINRLGCIFLDPVFQHSGMGTAIWQKIEAMFPETREWQTETPGFSRMNHYFYVNKCGFEIFRIDNPLSFEEASYQFRKTVPVSKNG